MPNRHDDTDTRGNGMTTSTDIQIEGSCDPRFAAVKDAFYQNFKSRGEVGAAVAVTVDGEPVVDLWGGTADSGARVPWKPDTIVCVQSVSKEIMALAVHMAVSRGLIDIDAPVTDYWPEYGQNGKEKTSIRWLLDHRAGVPVVDGARPGLAYDWAAMTGALAETRPLWEPGTTPCYHSANYGFLLGEPLRRVTGMSVGEFVRREIAEPLGVDCVFGLKPEEEARVATFLNKQNHPSQQWIDEGTNIFARSWKIFWDDEDFNSPEWRRAEVPSVNCHTNARSLARICAMMAAGGTLDGRHFLDAEVLDRAGDIQWTGYDAQDRYLSLSLGFLMPTAGQKATGPRALGMAGAGGATAFADPDKRIGFAYTMNSMDPDPGTPRPHALIDALNSVVG